MPHIRAHIVCCFTKVASSYTLHRYNQVSAAMGTYIAIFYPFHKKAFIWLNIAIEVWNIRFSHTINQISGSRGISSLLKESINIVLCGRNHVPLDKDSIKPRAWRCFNRICHICLVNKIRGGLAMLKVRSPVSPARFFIYDPIAPYFFMFV